MSRQSIHAAGYGHQTAIPTGSRIGPMLVSSIIVGFDEGTRNMPAEPEQQVANVFRHVGAILEAGDAGWGDVIKMTFFAADGATRDLIEAQWIERFPDPDSRPARFTETGSLPGSLVIRAEFMAYVAD